jgi:hypothetical protein
MRERALIRHAWRAALGVWVGWFRLVWWPPALGRVAVRTPAWIAYAAGSFAVAATTVALILALVLGIDEPYPTLRDYYKINRSHVGVAFLVLWVVVLTIFAGISAMGLRGGRTSARCWSYFRAAALLPVPFFLPAMVWAGFHSMAALADPSMSINSGYPAWMTSSPVLVLGSEWWLLAGMALAAWLAFAGRRDIRRLVPETGDAGCRWCGYELAGNTTGVCPECGAGRGGGEEAGGGDGGAGRMGRAYRSRHGRGGPPRGDHRGIIPE